MNLSIRSERKEIGPENKRALRKYLREAARRERAERIFAQFEMRREVNSSLADMIGLVDSMMKMEAAKDE